VAKPIMPGNVSENQDQPSPISVLEPPFEDDNATLDSTGNIKPEHQGNLSLSLSLGNFLFI
jgi:hypothetical protein